MSVQTARLSPRRSKTRTGRVLPISAPLRQVLARRVRVRRAGDRRVFRRDGVPVRVWRTALRDECRKGNVPHRLLHDCRRTAARNLIRAGVSERIARHCQVDGHRARSSLAADLAQISAGTGHLIPNTEGTRSQHAMVDGAQHVTSDT